MEDQGQEILIFLRARIIKILGDKVQLIESNIILILKISLKFKMKSNKNIKLNKLL